MRSRTAVTVLAGLGLSVGGVAATVAPALATSTAPTTVDTTPDSDEGSTTATDDATSESDPIATTLQALVDDGTLTQAQADAVSEAIVEVLPVRGGRGGGLAASLDALTEVLGMTIEDLRTAFADGQSIADVAAAQGLDVQTVIDALVATATERIDEAVTDGRLTEQEAATRTAALTARITELVEQAGGPDIGGRRRGDQMGPGSGQTGPGNGGPGGPGSGHDGPGHGNGPPPDGGSTTNSTSDGSTSDSGVTASTDA